MLPLNDLSSAATDEFGEKIREVTINKYKLPGTIITTNQATIPHNKRPEDLKPLQARLVEIEWIRAYPKINDAKHGLCCLGCYTKFFNSHTGWPETNTVKRVGFNVGLKKTSTSTGASRYSPSCDPHLAVDKIDNLVDNKGVNFGGILQNLESKFYDQKSKLF